MESPRGKTPSENDLHSWRVYFPDVFDCTMCAILYYCILSIIAYHIIKSCTIVYCIRLYIIVYIYIYERHAIESCYIHNHIFNTVVLNTIMFYMMFLCVCLVCLNKTLLCNASYCILSYHIVQISSCHFVIYHKIAIEHVYTVYV